MSQGGPRSSEVSVNGVRGERRERERRELNGDLAPALSHPSGFFSPLSLFLVPGFFCTSWRCPGTPGGTYLELGTSAHLYSRMNRLEFGGQRSRSPRPHKTGPWRCLYSDGGFPFSVLHFTGVRLASVPAVMQ